MINDPGCCGAHYSLQSRVPDPRLLAFVTADEYAKKLKALDEMFVAQTSRVRLLEKLMSPNEDDNEGYDCLVHMVDHFRFRQHVIIVFDCLSFNLYKY